MAKALITKHIQAIELRRQGKSYTEIKNILGVSKSTLSGWLNDYPLDSNQLYALRGRSERRIENFRLTMSNKRDKRHQFILHNQVDNLLSLSEKGLYVAGLFLYWGEGLKAGRGEVSLSNSDPLMIKFYIYWLMRVFNIPKQKLRIRLHLYSDMDISQEIAFWSRELKIPEEQFQQPYVKQSRLSGLNYRGFGHGTCDVKIGSIELKEKILLGIKAIAEAFKDKI